MISDRLWLKALLLFACAQAGTQAQAADPGGSAAQEARLDGSVVRIDVRAVPGAPSARSLGSRRTGSGVVIGKQLVLTIGYLVLEADGVEVVTHAGKRIPASVAGYDHASGFGLLRTALPMDAAPIALGDSDRVAEHQRVRTQGQGEDDTTELMVVSRKPFAGGWEYMLERPIYTFPAVNNWSGAALFNNEGLLVGIGSLMVGDAADELRDIAGNLFVPVNLVKPILQDLIEQGRRRGPAQPWLGMTTDSVRGHLMVSRVSAEGPAREAGIAPGDVIVSVAGAPVDGLADFYRRLWTLGPAGTEVTLTLLKGGALREVKLRSVDRMDVLYKPAGV